MGHFVSQIPPPEMDDARREHKSFALSASQYMYFSMS